MEDADVVPPPDDPPGGRAASAEQPSVRVSDDIAARPLQMNKFKGSRKRAPINACDGKASERSHPLSAFERRQRSQRAW
jgi:hypothetical protein